LLFLHPFLLPFGNHGQGFADAGLLGLGFFGGGDPGVVFALMRGRHGGVNFEQSGLGRQREGERVHPFAYDLDDGGLLFGGWFFGRHQEI